MVDLGRQHAPLRSAILDMVDSVLRSGAFAGGHEVEAFEAEFATSIGAAECVAVSTGTSALTLACRALGVRRGDDVIVPTNSFVATAEAVCLAGARPVFCDVDPDTALLTADTVDSVRTPRTVGVIPVHLYGHMVDMDELSALADRHRWWMIEDAAQAHGARLGHGEGTRFAGSLGDVGCFSFYPSKNLGAIGEGGAIVTSRPEVARRVRALRDHGQYTKHAHAELGDNARLASIQAGALRVKLPYVSAWNARRRAIASTYRRALRAGPPEPLLERPDGVWSAHQVVVRVRERERWRRDLRSLGVETGIHYPVPIHLQPAFRGFGHGLGSLPNAESLARHIVSLPVFAEMTDEEIAHVVASLSEVPRPAVNGRVVSVAPTV